MLGLWSRGGYSVTFNLTHHLLLHYPCRLGLQFEHGLLTQLHEKIVIQGSFDEAEALLHQASSQNLFDEYISDLPYKPKWKRILPKVGLDGNATAAPSMRGGHQMCIDSDDGIIYLFGTPLLTGLPLLLLHLTMILCRWMGRHQRFGRFLGILRT